MAQSRPEIANSIKTGGFNTNYHDIGSGHPVFFLHGSGPGVTAWANWNKLFPLLKDEFRIIAPDLVGFGFTERPADAVYNLNNWVRQTIDLYDALNIEKANLVGNSFGGALALSMAIKYPERVNKLVLMGSMGVTFPITYGLDAVWGYTPSLANMEELLEIFTYDHSFSTPELIKTRYESSMQLGFQESFSSMFPEPRQKGVERMACNENYIRSIPHETLIIHGREDRVIPIETSLRLIQLIDRAQLHVFGHCGHWTQIEHTEEFAGLLRNFFKE
ncbi:MAG: alpha/beta fold hydrolase [Synergistaceae bacterium]|jgi:2-hydroxymuconate-semialdehyde hydrolase|nr:alpha/beta fold hydrolase [Synergistaceae bacterium]